MDAWNQEKKRGGLLRLLVILGIVAAGVALARLTGASDYINLKSLLELAERVRDLGWISPLVYVLVWVAAGLFFLPGSPITILGALVFGPWWGLVLTTVGANLGAEAAFLAGRYAARDLVRGWADKNPLFKKLDDGVRAHGWRMVIITRLVPLFPFNFQNYAYGLTGIRFSTYALLSVLCMIPGTAAFTFSAGSLVGGGGDAKKTIIYLAAGGVLFVIASLIPGLIKKKYHLDRRD